MDGVEIEGRILEKLGAKKVRNIPTILCWSDAGPVSIHCTQTDAYKNFNWNLHDPERKMVRLTHRVHYHQVTEEAGYTLEQLKGTYELLEGANDVFQALHDAHRLCNRFHRDVSSTNIILFADTSHLSPERRAILSDGELSNEDVPGPARDCWISVRRFSWKS
ncbi:hypothetical protein BDN70DRAFT_979909 [Pholiota conissans]|uniref:Fungal-type protein kinase domain-containing protein n=1 Tax=Pholiota conissans TaxID=109636 RepID=A0A9P5YL29_9AGAR|nr:hypothetical protein BDN70DRAFT_979909 [Pholiota conissans]